MNHVKTWARAVIMAFLLLVLGVGLAVAPAQADTEQSPDAVVKSIADELAKAIEGRHDELAQNKDELVKLIDDTLLPHFAVDYAAILVLGKHARTATPEQRSRFAKAFYTSLTRRYADALLDYTRGSVTVLPQRGELNPKRTIVRSQVKLNNDKTVSVNYVFRQDKNTGKWLVYDVVIEGISYITNYRNQVDSEIKKDGLDKLIERLEAQDPKVLDKLEKNPT